MSFFGGDPFFEYWPEVMSTPSRLWNQDFGLALPGVVSDFSLMPFEGSSRRERPRGRAARSEVVSDKEKFEVTLDMPGFKTNEISVKVVDNALVVDAEHEERPDEHGHVTRRFRRRYFLPRSVDPEQIHSCFSDDGVLKITAKKDPSRVKAFERNVEIKQVGSSTEQPAIQGQQQQQQQQQQGQVQGEGKLPYAHSAAAGDVKIPVQHGKVTGQQQQQHKQTQAAAK